MTDSTQLQPLSSLLTQLRTQSTIYRSHETRLARSFELKDDARPPIIRVLSLLPGFSLFVPKYEPAITAREVLKKAPLIGEYTEETIFCDIDGEACRSVVASQQQLDPAEPQPFTASTQTLHLPAIIATAAIAAIYQTMPTLPQMSASNPIHAVPKISPRRVSTILTNNSPMTQISLIGSIITRSSQYLMMMNVAKQPQRQSTLAPHVSMVAASVGLLFGTRDFLAPEYGSLVASAAAGVLASLPALIYKSQQQAIAAPTILLPMHLARHAIGGMSYFGVYEYIRGNGDSIWQTAMAGSLAGVAGATLTVPTRTIWRAAPAHAMVWCVYEHVVGPIATTTTMRKTPKQDLAARHQNLYE